MIHECKHCKGTGKCYCNHCNDKANVRHGFFDSWEVVCSVCGGKGWHEETFYGPHLPRAPWMKF
jgi:hypothetical protein